MKLFRCHEHIIALEEGFKSDTGNILFVSFRLFEETQEVIDLFDAKKAFLPEEHHAIATGDVKWDGCINWKTHESYMVHGCTVQNVVNFGQALRCAYQLAWKACENDYDEDPSMPEYEEIQQ